MSRHWIELINDDVIEYVTEFLSPRDILTAMRVNGYWEQICKRDSIWLRFCVRRWNLDAPQEIRKACGTEDFYELFDYLDRNGLVPQGKFTSKHQLIWGKNCQQGTDVWITVAHRSDCRLLVGPRASSYIQLRLVVQNLEHTPLTVDFQDMRVDWKDSQQGLVLGIGRFGPPSLAPRLVAFNGDDTTVSLVNHQLKLEFFDFAVVTVNVDCDDCEFEADFLERCSAVWLPIRRPGPCTSLNTCRCGLIPDNYHHGSVRVPIVDESVIWKHYKPVSGRFMVLDHRSTPFKYPFALCHGSRSSPKTSALRKPSISS